MRGFLLLCGCMTEQTRNDDLKSFLIVLRQALLMLVGWIEKRYGLQPRSER
jgi:hypothetical protein